jgi:hypothetical protein
MTPLRSILAMLLLATLATRAADGAVPAFDLSRAEADGLRVSADGAIELLAGDVYPSLTLRPADGRWDLSAKRFLEVDVTNEWTKPLVMTWWALSPGGWGGVSSYPLNPDGRDTIAPGKTQSLKIDLHARYPGPDVQTNATDAANVDRIRFVFHVRQAGARVRVANLRATGEFDGAPHDVGKRIIVQPITDDAPAAGKRVRRALPSYEKTEVRHVLSLPRDWTPDKRYPVIVEYTGNVFYHKFCHSTGKTEQGNLAYGMSGGDGYICLNLPFISPDGQREQVDAWGDVAKTVDYCIDAVNDTCERFGGDSSAVFVTGFSRGAYACNYIALHDERIADVWLGFDRDPAKPWNPKNGKGWNNVGVGWDERAARVKGRATFNGAADFGPGVHVDVEYVEDTPVRRDVRAWLAESIRTRPGTHTVRGRVTDAAGKSVAGVRIQSGPTHFTVTDDDGSYTLRSLIVGKRVVSASKPGANMTPERRDVELGDADLTGVDFVTR